MRNLEIDLAAQQGHGALRIVVAHLDRRVGIERDDRAIRQSAPSTARRQRCRRSVAAPLPALAAPRGWAVVGCACGAATTAGAGLSTAAVKKLSATTTAAPTSAAAQAPSAKRMARGLASACCSSGKSSASSPKTSARSHSAARPTSACGVTRIGRQPLVERAPLLRAQATVEARDPKARLLACSPLVRKSNDFRARCCHLPIPTRALPCLRRWRPSLTG